MTCSLAMLQEFETELLTTRRFLERIPDDKLDWRPHHKSMSAGELGLHIAQVPAGVLQLGLQDEGAPPDFGQRPRPASVPDILAALDHTAAYLRRVLPTVDEVRLGQEWKLVRDGRTVMSMPRSVFLRRIMLNHWYHHRGQLGVFLRLLGTTVPASYGPSGDESM